MLKDFQLKAAEEAGSYREFLSLLMHEGLVEIPRGKLSAISFRAGFASRSFITDVLNSKKRLTPLSLPKIISALRLKGELKTLFERLVAVEEEDVRSMIQIRDGKILNKESLEKRIHRLRTQIKQKNSRQPVVFEAHKIDPHGLSLVCVYAALGEPSLGASLKQISKKLKLDLNIIQKCLNILIVSGLVRLSEKRYFASERSFNLDNLGKNLSFINAFSQAAKELSDGAKKIAQDENQLIFLTAAPLQPLKLREMKIKLKEALLNVIEEYQDDDGTIIHKIILASYS